VIESAKAAVLGLLHRRRDALKCMGVVGVSVRRSGLGEDGGQRDLHLNVCDCVLFVDEEVDFLAARTNKAQHAQRETGAGNAAERRDGARARSAQTHLMMKVGSSVSVTLTCAQTPEIEWKLEEGSMDWMWSSSCAAGAA
jgi:hypothetical protein